MTCHSLNQLFRFDFLVTYKIEMPLETGGILLGIVIPSHPALLTFPHQFEV